MNNRSESEIRDLSNSEIDLVAGGGGPTGPSPTFTNAGMAGGHDVYQISCPYGYGVEGTQGSSAVDPVAGNAYSGFSCSAGGSTEYAYAWQGSGMWNVDMTAFW